MNNLEKVIKWLECCNSASCQKCPYNEKWECNNKGFFYSQAIEDALALLKEQEEPKPGHWIPVESTTGVEAFGIKEMTVQTVRCSVCGTEEDVSFSAYRFCPRCGTKMEGR